MVELRDSRQEYLDQLRASQRELEAARKQIIELQKPSIEQPLFPLPVGDVVLTGKANEKKLRLPQDGTRDLPETVTVIGADQILLLYLGNMKQFEELVPDRNIQT